MQNYPIGKFKRRNFTENTWFCFEVVNFWFSLWVSFFSPLLWNCTMNRIDSWTYAYCLWLCTLLFRFMGVDILKEKPFSVQWFCALSIFRMRPICWMSPFQFDKLINLFEHIGQFRKRSTQCKRIRCLKQYYNLKNRSTEHDRRCIWVHLQFVCDIHLATNNYKLLFIEI